MTPSFNDSVCADTEERPTVSAASTTANKFEKFFILQTPEKIGAEISIADNGTESGFVETNVCAQTKGNSDSAEILCSLLSEKSHFSPAIRTNSSGAEAAVRSPPDQGDTLYAQPGLSEFGAFGNHALVTRVMQSKTKNL
jgi:hypothetical protein